MRKFATDSLGKITKEMRQSITHKYRRGIIKLSSAEVTSPVSQRGAQRSILADWCVSEIYKNSLTQFPHIFICFFILFALLVVVIIARVPAIPCKIDFLWFE